MEFNQIKLEIEKLIEAFKGEFKVMENLPEDTFLSHTFRQMMEDGTLWKVYKASLKVKVLNTILVENELFSLEKLIELIDEYAITRDLYEPIIVSYKIAWDHRYEAYEELREEVEKLINSEK